MLKSNPCLLSEHGGLVELSKEWAHKLLRRMGFMKWKATTSKSRMSVSNLEDMKKEFLQVIVDLFVMEETQPELILNWDQTGINFVPSSGWTMEQRGATRVEVMGIDDKRQITAVFCSSLTGDFCHFNSFIVAKLIVVIPTLSFHLTDITHAPKRWSTEETTKGYIENIILPYIRRTQEVLGQNQRLLLLSWTTSRDR